jgi:hypothetical protein
MIPFIPVFSVILLQVGTIWFGVIAHFDLSKEFPDSRVSSADAAPGDPGKFPGFLPRPVIPSRRRFQAKQNKTSYLDSRELLDRRWLIKSRRLFFLLALIAL